MTISKEADSGRRGLPFRADIEGLRAVAILLVVAAHANVPWLAGGFVGVDVFFVLSGYLITGLLLREATATGAIRFADFYARRFRRLMPGLLLMLACTGLAAWLLVAPPVPLVQREAPAPGSRHRRWSTAAPASGVPEPERFAAHAAAA